MTQITLLRKLLFVIAASFASGCYVHGRVDPPHDYDHHGEYHHEDHHDDPHYDRHHDEYPH